MRRWWSICQCQTTLNEETSAPSNLNFLQRCKDTNWSWEGPTYAIPQAKAKRRQLGMQSFLQGSNCIFWIKLCQSLRFDMSRHALKFFKLRDGLKRKSITSTFLLDSQKGIHTQHLPAFLWEGRKELKQHNWSNGSSREGWICYWNIWKHSWVNFVASCP